MDRSLLTSPTASGEAARSSRPALDEDTPSPFGPVVHPDPPGDDGDCVLVVEDDAAVRHIVELFLRADGWEVLTADSAAAGERLFTEHRSRIGLVLTDVVMPGDSGFVLARRLRAASPHTPVLGMSGYNGVGDQPGDHFHHYIEKPFAPGALIAAVRAHYRPPVA